MTHACPTEKRDSNLLMLALVAGSISTHLYSISNRFKMSPEKGHLLHFYFYFFVPKEVKLNELQTHLLQNSSVLSRASRFSTTDSELSKKKKKATEATPNFARASTHCLASINMYFTAGLENLCRMFLQSEGKGSINKFLQV